MSLSPGRGEGGDRKPVEESKSSGHNKIVCTRGTPDLGSFLTLYGATAPFKDYKYC